MKLYLKRGTNYNYVQEINWTVTAIGCQEKLVSLLILKVLFSFGGDKLNRCGVRVPVVDSTDTG